MPIDAFRCGLAPTGVHHEPCGQVGEIEALVESLSERRRAHPVTRSTKVRCRTDASLASVQDLSAYVPGENWGRTAAPEISNDSDHTSFWPS
jgi:hypothetical protein